MIKDEIIDLARIECQKQGITLPLVLGFIETESGGDQWAYNPEPKYRYLWSCRAHAPFRPITKLEDSSEYPPDDFPAPEAGVDPDAEWWGQQASWGLMQVMGAVAREVGFRGPFLTSLCDPEINLAVGCTKLKRLLKQWGDPEMAACAYNRGSVGYVPNTKEFLNQKYVDKVMLNANFWLSKGV